MAGPGPYDRHMGDTPQRDATEAHAAWPATLRQACGLLLLPALLAISWLALMPAPPPQADTGWDKANHLLAFATLTLLAEGAFGPAWRARAGSAAGLLAYGALIELVQSQLPPRCGEWADLLADALGIVAGLGLATVGFGLRSCARRRRASRSR